MIEIAVPGREPFQITSVVLDYNGTIAVDGKIPMELKPLLVKLRKLLPVFVLTADTYGSARAQCEPLGLQVRTFPQENAAVCKEEIVRELGGKNVACLGNGFNDISMFQAAGLGIAVLDGEGLCTSLLPHATVLCRSSAEALALLLNPKRVIADLRS